MKIGVVADTHSLELPEQLVKDFKTVDLIVHAGDFSSVKDLAVFKKMAEVKAVYGNADDATLCRTLLEVLTFNVNGFEICVFHGTGIPKNVLQSVQERFKKKTCDVIIFGHSHNAMNEKIDGVLYFNPGSPNDMITAPYCSYGILEISKKGVVGEIKKVKF